MATRELGTLETVPVTEIWPHEERNFTKWMAEDLTHLEKVVGMELELVGREYRTEDRGRVDILATDRKTGRRVVIENQIYSSDNDHFTRMISYAASTEAQSIIWVAPYFYDVHVKMLRWLTEAGVDAFGVKIGAVRIGDAYAPQFEVVVNPEQAADSPDANSDTGPNIYSRFYRPLVESLRGEGIRAMSGRDHGGVGRHRRYRSGTLLEDAGITYYSKLGTGDEQCKVGLLFHEGEHLAPYGPLFHDRAELEDSMGDIEITWVEGEMENSISVSSAGIHDEEEATLIAKREWIMGTLLRLRDNFEPMIQDIIRG